MSSVPEIMLVPVRYQPQLSHYAYFDINDRIQKFRINPYDLQSQEHDKQAVMSCKYHLRIEIFARPVRHTALDNIGS